MDQRAGSPEVLATILDLARRGWLTIREVHPSGIPAEGPGVPLLKDILSRVGLWETEWEFSRTDKPTDALRAFEGSVLIALFADDRTVTASALSGSLRERLPAVRSALYGHLVRRGWFLARPDRVRRDWFLLAAGLAAAAAVALEVTGAVDRAVGLAMAGALVALAAPAMPAATLAGARARAEVLGVGEYLRRAERAEIEARYADETAPARIDALLPWAIALGVTDLWVQRFEAMLPEDRPWYETVRPGSAPVAGRIGAFCAVAGLMIEGGG